jgi:hypothetical protein
LTALVRCRLRNPYDEGSRGGSWNVFADRRAQAAGMVVTPIKLLAGRRKRRQAGLLHCQGRRYADSHRPGNRPGWKDIARWNNLDNANLIEVGQVLRSCPPAPAAVGGATETGVVDATCHFVGGCSCQRLPPAGPGLAASAAVGRWRLRHPAAPPCGSLSVLIDEEIAFHLACFGRSAGRL